MNATAVYARHPDYVQRDVAGECILVPIRRSLAEANSIYVLNETGASLWNRLDGHCSLQDIMAAFSEEYDVTTDQLHRDVETLLADLLSIHAIEEVAVADNPAG
jgi:Coenzyme PQQ synthesis protein D (PqqD)